VHVPRPTRDPPVLAYDLEKDPWRMRDRTAALYAMQVYDLAQDRAEQQNLAPQRAREIEDSRGWIDRTYRTSLKRWELKYKDTSVSRHGTEAEIQQRLDEIELELQNLDEIHALGYLTGEELLEEKEELELEARELRLKLAALREKARSGAKDP
jgi:hypothetical protein